jgi:hypothetical protein
MIDEKLCHEALQRFARDAAKPGDGELFYVLLQKVLLGFPTAAAGADISGALRENLGRRKLAAELMAVMAEVMAEPIGDRGNDEQRAKLARGERPVIFQFPRPNQRRRQPGARRRGIGEPPTTEPDAG